MKIIVDAMGGDKAPEETVKGALEAARTLGTEIALVGIRDKLEAYLKTAGVSLGGNFVEIINAKEIITMDDEPSNAVRAKKDSSMSVALGMLRDGKGDAVVSAGSTGALLAGATLIVKRIKGIRRAALAPVLPAGKHGVILIDCGANAECTGEYLLQFAFMGSFYAGKILGISKPKIGLLNVGSEETKGGELQKYTYSILQKASDAGRINFSGNVEPEGVLSAQADVIVTDGFSGNILLKSVEGSMMFVFSQIKELMLKNSKTKIAASMIKSDLLELKSRFDPREIGGTALLGISKPVIKAHGSSDSIAFKNAIAQAAKFVEKGVIGEIIDNIQYMTIGNEDLNANES